MVWCEARVEAAAVAATLALHLRWRNALVSIIGGTAVHVVLATLLAS